VEGVEASKEEGNDNVSFETKDGDTDKCRTSCHRLWKPIASFSVRYRVGEEAMG